MRRAGPVALVLMLAVTGMACDRPLRPGGTRGGGDGGDGGGSAQLGSGNGYVDRRQWRGRQDEYLDFATERLDPSSLPNMIAHFARAQRDHGFRFDPDAIGPDAFAATFAKIDSHTDTSDFDMMRLVALGYAHRRELRPDLRAAIKWRATEWRTHDPAATFTNGLAEPFDLVAAGGADNVWIGEVGDADRWGSFDAFVAALSAAAIDVTNLGSAGGVSRGFEVSYASPSEGRMTFSWTGPLAVDGAEVPLHGTDRFDNAFGTTAFGDTTVRISDGPASLTLDLARGERRAELRPG